MAYTCQYVGSLTVKGKKPQLTYIPQLEEAQGTTKKIFILPAVSWEEEAVL